MVYSYTLPKKYYSPSADFARGFMLHEHFVVNFCLRPCPPAFILACGPTYLKIRFLVCLSWKDMQKGLRWGAKLSGVGKYEAASDVQHFLTALRGPSAPTSLLPYYQFPCPLQTNAGYSKPQPNCVTATLRKSYVKFYCCTSETSFSILLFVCL